MMNQQSLRMLGLGARSARLLGLAPLLQMTRDLSDFAFLRLRKVPLKVYIDGHTVHGFFRHRSFLYQWSTGNYQSFQVELFKRHISPGMTVVDGGAHIGFFSLLAARLVGDKGRVFSFEPDNYNYPCLDINICENKYQNVTLFQKAIADKVESKILYQSSGTISSSLGNREGIKKFSNGVSVKKVLIQSTTLDHEIGCLPVDIIKLNIEGAEPFAVMGMSRILQRSIPLILFAEINPHALHSLGKPPEFLITMLKDLGFDIYYIDELNRKLLPLTEKSILQKGILYCKKGK